MSYYDDKPLPEDAAIEAAHPLKTGRHDLYQDAMRMVGAKHSKGALVDLVTWLLYKNDNLSKAAHEAITKWNDYERDYIVPAYDWAKEVDFDLISEVMKGGGNCVSLLVRHLINRVKKSTTCEHCTEPAIHSLCSTHFHAAAEHVYKLPVLDSDNMAEEANESLDATEVATAIIFYRGYRFKERYSYASHIAGELRRFYEAGVNETKAVIAELKVSSEALTYEQWVKGAETHLARYIAHGAAPGSGNAPATQMPGEAASMGTAWPTEINLGLVGTDAAPAPSETSASVVSIPVTIEASPEVQSRVASRVATSMATRGPSADEGKYVDPCEHAADRSGLTYLTETCDVMGKPGEKTFAWRERVNKNMRIAFARGWSCAKQAADSSGNAPSAGPSPEHTCGECGVVGAHATWCEWAQRSAGVAKIPSEADVVRLLMSLRGYGVAAHTQPNTTPNVDAAKVIAWFGKCLRGEKQ